MYGVEVDGGWWLAVVGEGSVERGSCVWWWQVVEVVSAGGSTVSDDRRRGRRMEGAIDGSLVRCRARGLAQGLVRE